jgi:hypothetical protein
VRDASLRIQMKSNVPSILLLLRDREHRSETLGDHMSIGPLKSSRRVRASHGLILLLCLVVSAFAIAYPMYVIRPYRSQGPAELAIALFVSRFQSLITVVSTLVALVTAVAYWRQGGRLWRRILAVIPVGALAALAVIARVNIFENMFHPIDNASFAAASDAKLDGDEKVLAVVIKGQARAYPVRSMAYHHLVNDSVGGAALVATY